MDDRPRQSLNWWRWVGWLVTCLALGFIIRWIITIDQAAWQNIRQVDPGWLVGSLVVFQIWFIMRFWAWEFIVRRHGSESQRHETLRTWTLSELARYIPGNFWSFAAKYRASVSGGASTPDAITALAIEATSQLAGAGITAALWYNGRELWWVALLIIVLYPLLLPVLLIVISRIKHQQIIARISLTESLGVILWYAVLWIIFGIATAMIYRGFPGVPIATMSWLIGVNVAAWLIGYVSIITPMGLGVREVAFVKLSAQVLSNTVASIIALVTRIWLVVGEVLFLGLVLIWSRRQRS